MDPDCAICSAPANLQCQCEAKGLDIAVKQAEHQMMTGVFTEIRNWVRSHAQDYILNYFGMLRARRKDLHAAAIQRITDHAWHYYRAQPHPSEIANADMELKRGIDEDWMASVQRYPSVLEYYYGLVDLSLPGDHEPHVLDPPMSALNGGKQRVRLREEGGGGGRRRKSRVSIEPIPPPPEPERRRRPGVSFAPGYEYVQAPY